MKHKLQPESQMMSYGYKPELFKGAVKLPIFQTSTFEFASAEEGKAFFELAYGLREARPGEEMGYIYSRIDNPNLKVLESRLCLWDKAEECAVFESGMAAISNTFLEFVKPGDLLLFSNPTYGGTDHFINHFLKELGVEVIGFSAEHTEEDLIEMVQKSGKADKLAMVFLETPANPTNDLIDISMCRRVADFFSSAEKTIPVAVDNTFMGPLWSHPMEHGADLVIYSATKYIGGHSDLIAGAVLGSSELMKRVRTLRSFLGNMPSPQTCWLLLRSLETLKVRMQQQMKNARRIAAFLATHPKVKEVHYLGLLKEGTRAFDVYKRQYNSPGAMLSLYVKGGEKEAFTFMNNLKLFKLAVSLGSTESLVQHPASMTHAGVDPESRQAMGVTDALVRLSIGVEDYNDLIWDIEQAFEAVPELEWVA